MSPKEQPTPEPRTFRLLFLSAGWAALIIGAIGALLPVLPTVPFVILAAFCFTRGSPQLEARLLDHPHFGPHIRAWRERGAISRKGKVAAVLAFTVSMTGGILLVPWPWWLVPVVVALVGVPWVWSRPDA